ncbi:MAG: glycosyl hydrolase [Epsilonproteobacteria bacterium]|nr:glycosyl hydrolase [Campylobacterota bacterium]
MKNKSLVLVSLLLFSGCVSEKVVANEQPTPLVQNQAQNIKKEKSLEQKIGSMLMVGFMGTLAPKNSQICKDIAKYDLGSVILFDVNPTNKLKPKNFVSKAQVSKLTEQLQACSRDGKLLIAVDQEGGRVQRLKSKYGFYGKFPKAKEVRCLTDNKVMQHYQKMGAELQSVGINYNLAPDVDLAINKKNRVIYKLGRSFGTDPKEVVHYSSIFIDAMHQNGVLTSAKHFPGHGSSLGDTHKGFVDVTNLWKKKELEPYKILTQKGVLDTVMVAHVFNKKLDAKYPATLSHKTVNGLLRAKLGFDGVVITDDLQMGAIANKYGLKNTLKLAIGAGNDILLFGNQLSPKSMVSTKKLVDTIKTMVQNGEVSLADIEKSNERIEQLKQGI